MIVSMEMNIGEREGERITYEGEKYMYNTDYNTVFDVQYTYVMHVRMYIAFHLTLDNNMNWLTCLSSTFTMTYFRLV